MMEPNALGRKLGTGVRVASKMLRERSQTWGAGVTAGQRSNHTVGAAPGAAASPLASAQQSAAGRAHIAAEKTRTMGRASKRFGEAVWGPLVHLSGVLWLEVTGLFFAIFALFFAQSVYRLRHAWLTGQEHTKFLLYLAITVAFVYFAFSSFYRARGKGRRARQQQPR